MITKIGANLNFYSNNKQNNIYNRGFKSEILSSGFQRDYVSFTGEKKDSQQAKLANIQLYMDSSSKKLFNELWKEAQKDKYNSITPMHVLRHGLKETYEYLDSLNKGDIEFEKEKIPEFANYLSECVTLSLFKDKNLRKNIMPIIKSYTELADEIIKTNKPKTFDKNKKLTISDEMIDFLWAYRTNQNDTITPDTILYSILDEVSNEDLVNFIDSMIEDLNEKSMIKNVPLSDRKPFSGYEPKAKGILKNLALGTNMFITYDLDKDDYISFLDTIYKVAEKEKKYKIIEFNENASEDFLNATLNKIEKDKNHEYLLILDPTSIIINCTDPEKMAQGRFMVPPKIMDISTNQPSNLKIIFHDTKNNYYAFGDTANYTKFQETSIPSLTSEQMLQFFRENPKTLPKQKVQFTKGAQQKAIMASAQLDGAFPKKTANLMSKIAGYYIDKKEITEKDVNNYLKEANSLFKKSNDDSNIEIEFDTGKRLKHMTGRISTRKEAEQIVKQIKSKKMGTKGLIVYSQDGSPGSGRKFTIQAIAGDAKVPFIEVNTVDFGTKDVEIFGFSMSSEASMKKLFSLVKTQAEANPNKSAVLFIENFEYFAVGELVSRYHEKAMAQLLREMSKANEEGLNILVAGSVSSPQLIGEATMKSFKFIDSIEVASPAINKQDRAAIIAQALKDNKVRLAGDDKTKAKIINHAADITDGFAFIHLKNLVKKSKSVAEERGHKLLTKGDITEAYLQLTTGRASANKVEPHEKLITTSHECGHATNLTVMNSIAKNYGKAWHVPSKVDFVTLDPRGFYGGAVYHGTDTNDNVSFESSFAELVCAFGGNSAEKHFFGMDGSWGITGDMDYVRRRTAAMVKKMGFGAQVGKMNVGPYDNLSDNMKQMVENDQRVIINNAKITSELITEIYEDFNKWFTQKYSPLVGTGDCLVDGDEFRKALSIWRKSQSPEKQRELELCDKTILQIIDATKKGIAVKKEN